MSDTTSEAPAPAAAPEQAARTPTQPTAPEGAQPPEAVLPEPPGVFAQGLTAFAKSIAGRPELTGPARVLATMGETSASMRSVAKLYAPEIADLTAEEKLAQKSLRVLTTTIDSYEALVRHQSDLKTVIHEGDISTALPKTREQFERDHELLCEVARQNLQDIYKRTHPVCKKISDVYTLFASDVVDRQEKYEKNQHAHFGIPWPGPSSIVIAFRRAIAFAKTRVVYVENGTATPSDMLPFLRF